MKKELAGGGALIEHAVHAIDLALWLNESPSVSAYTIAAQNLDAKSYEGEDNFAILLSFKNGSTALIDGSYCRPSSGKRGDVVIKVHGDSKKNLSFSLFSQNIRAHVGEEPVVKEEEYSSESGGSSEEESGLRMIEDLLSSINTGAEPLTNGIVGENVNRVVDACYASLASGHEIAIEQS